MKKNIHYSVVIPLYNEEKNAKPLYSSLKSTLDELQIHYEIIFVDDGSDDNTFTELCRIATTDPNVKIIKFRKNFGQSAALAAGFENANGETILSMDGDLQNDPKDIQKLLRGIEEGYDLVCGWRRQRKDSFFTKKIPSIIFNRLASRISGVKIHDFGCTLRAYKKEVIKNMTLYGEMHRYIPALAGWKGYKITEVEVAHHPRISDKAKYGAGRLARGSLDMITTYFIKKYLTRPMHLFGAWGILCGLVGGLLAVYLLILRLIFNVPLSDKPLLLLAILMMILGVQFVMMGLIGEMFTIYQSETHGKKFYEIEEIINFDK